MKSALNVPPKNDGSIFCLLNSLVLFSTIEYVIGSQKFAKIRGKNLHFDENHRFKKKQFQSGQLSEFEM